MLIVLRSAKAHVVFFDVIIFEMKVANVHMHASGWSSSKLRTVRMFTPGICSVSFWSRSLSLCQCYGS